MDPIVTTAKIVCKSKEAREKVFAAFHKIVDFSKANEPGVLRYIVTIPIDDASRTDIYMIEEYADQAASDAHIATPPVQDLISLFSSGDVLASSPEVYNNTVVANKVVTGPLSVALNPAIVLANFEYTSGTLANAFKGWREVVEYVETNEDGTKAYAVLATEGGNEVRTVEVYESWDYVKNIHLKDKPFKGIQEKSGSDRTGLQGAVRVKAVDGFFGRDGGSKL